MKRIVKIFLFFFVLFLPFMVNAEDNKEITLHLFHGDGCPHCAEEIEFLESLQEDYPSLKVEKYEVWNNDENAKILQKVQEAFSVSRTGVPTTVIGDTVIVGFGSGTGSKIKRAVDYYLENDYENQVPKIIDGSFVKKENTTTDSFTEKEKKSDKAFSIDVPIIGKVNLKKVSLISAAVIIGLIDGFNPCAMWILLFLISVLLGMKNRKRMIIIGFTFLFTSAIVYMFIMLSWINIAVKMTSIIWIRNLIGVVALIGAFINLRSFLHSNDSGCEVVDDKKRKTIFKKIRKFTHEKSLFLALIGAVLLAVSVNVVELACSAGLPLVFTELLVLNKTSAMMKFVYTLLYIFFFLLDDLIIFFIAVFTMKVTGISTKYNKYSHLLGGIIMFIIGILLLVKPSWLMF